MKKLTLTIATLCASSAFVFAGPEPVEASSKDIVQSPVVETSCFEGFYFGIHGGGLLSNSDVRNSADEFAIGADDKWRSVHFYHSGGENEFGAQGGLHIGHNWQRGGWIFGFEVDLSASGLDETTTALAIVDLPNDFIPYTTEVHTNDC